MQNEFVTYYFNLFKADNDATFKERLETTFSGRRKIKLQTVFNACALLASLLSELTQSRLQTI